MRIRPWVRRVLVPAEEGDDEHRLLMPAAVVGTWFGAPIQLVAGDREVEELCTTVTANAGVPSEPAIVLDGDDFAQELVAHAERCQPSICVTTADELGLAVARQNRQATLLAPTGDERRVPTGPLVTALDGGPDDVDRLAMMAAWAYSLGVDVRLIVAEGVSPEALDMARGRLGDFDVEATVVRVGDGDGRPDLDEASGLEATAVVVSPGWLDGPGDGPGYAQQAAEAGVALLVAPTGVEPDANWPPVELTSAGPRHERLRLTGPEALTAEQSMTLLQEQAVGRLAYVDSEWPVIVPVNFSVHRGDVFIRGLPGAKLLAAQREDVVALEVDGFDPADESGWSVLVQGPLELIVDPLVLRAAWSHEPVPWIDADTWYWLRIRPLSVSGRQLAPLEPEPVGAQGGTSTGDDDG